MVLDFHVLKGRTGMIHSPILKVVLMLRLMMARKEKITISKIGSMRIILHRDVVGKIKTCTIKRDVDQWYAIFTVEREKQIVKTIEAMIGIDVGLTDLLALDNGEKIKPPKFLRQSELKLGKEQLPKVLYMMMIY